MAGSMPLTGYRILLVEDDFLVAEVILEMLEDAGASVLGPIGSVDDALKFIETHDEALDRAVLDLDLHGRKSYPVAEALEERGVPLVFMTGYSADAVDAAYRHHPHCVKPITHVQLLDELCGFPRTPPHQELGYS